MFDFFFYGTLIDPDIRELVLGRPIGDASVRAAVLAGYRRYPVRGEPYPAAVPDAAGSIEGVLVEGLGVTDAARLSRFEGSEYEAISCAVSLTETPSSVDRSAWVFIAKPSVPIGHGEWSIGTWAQDHKARFVALANTWLDGAGDRVAVDTYETAWRDRIQEN